jgi:type II secretory pathway pseudopilin PulG
MKLRLIPTCQRQRLAFTLVEMLASLGIFVAIVMILAAVLTQATRAWRSATEQMQTAQSARVALDLLDRDLQGLFVNNQYSSTFAPTSLSFFTSVPNPSGAWDICRVRYSVESNRLLRFFEYVTAVGTSSTTSITTEVIPNVWSLSTAGNAGFTLSYITAEGSFVSFNPAVGTTTVPSRIRVELKLTSLESLRAGGSLTMSPTATYTRTIFIPQSFR